MHNEAIVLELSEKYAIVLDEGGRVHRIKRKKDMKIGDRIYYVEEDRFQSYYSQKKTIPFMRYIAAAAVFVLLFTGVFASMVRNQTYAAMAMGTASHPLTMEFRKDGRIKYFHDPSSQISEKDFIGKTLEEAVPLLIEYADNLGIQDLILSSTYSQEEFSKIQGLLASLQKNSNKIGILLMNGTLEDYEKSKSAGNSLSADLIREREIPLWSDEDALLFAPERKNEILGERGQYYQTDTDVQRREEIRRVEAERRAEEERRAQEERERAEREEREEQRRQEEQRRAAPAPQPLPQRQPQRVQPRRQAPAQRAPVRRAPVYNDDYDDDDDDDDWDDDDDDDD